MGSHCRLHGRSGSSTIFRYLIHISLDIKTCLPQNTMYFPSNVLPAPVLDSRHVPTHLQREAFGFLVAYSGTDFTLTKSNGLEASAIELYRKQQNPIQF